MLIRELTACREFAAGDGTRLRELLHGGTDKARGVRVRYSLAHAVLAPSLASRPHRLSTSEVYYILEGSGIMHIDGETARVSPGSMVHIPPGAVQHIANDGAIPLVFLCIVDPAWRKEDEEVF